jgi:hypothetical protein
MQRIIRGTLLSRTVCVVVQDGVIEAAAIVPHCRH